jgi:hypothetical protein
VIGFGFDVWIHNVQRLAVPVPVPVKFLILSVRIVTHLSASVNRPDKIKNFTGT